ncbi:MAG TPA: Trm112 family protein [Acidimicrobiia bacterium]|nr:Trm112 family protein [Acidimicrobiia bacterium]
MTLIAPELLEILRCPVDHTPVHEDVPASVLRCEAEPAHTYPVRDGIPDMIPPHEEV